jgi:hypothetical protein
MKRRSVILSRGDGEGSQEQFHDAGEVPRSAWDDSMGRSAKVKA